MIKKICIIASLVVVFSLVFAAGISSAANDYSPAVFKTTAFEALPGGTVTTTLYLEENSNVMDFEMQLDYDTEFVELISAAKSSALSGDMEITEKEGAVHISYTRTSENLTKKTDLAVLTFTVNENIGPDSYEYLTLNKAYHHEAHTMIGTNLYAVPIETEFASLDIYNFGDINLSHSVSIADVTYLRQYLAEMRPLSEYQLGLADAYYDKEIAITDAVRIQQYLAYNTVQMGNRVNISFLDKDQQVYRIKSVVFGEQLFSIPSLPIYSGYYGGIWSTSPDEALGADFRNICQPLTVYAAYKKDASAAITFYKERLTDIYYSQPSLSGNINLVSKLNYQNGFSAEIYWSSSDSSVLNASTGVFSKPPYDTAVTLTATIISYQDGSIEAQDYIAFNYAVKGEFLCPSKTEINQYLASLFTGTINYNMTLPSKVTDNDIASESSFEVRLTWLKIDPECPEGEPVVQLVRGNSEKTVSLVAIAEFNGEPLEDDGKMYFDNICVGAVSMDEVRSYIITQIAAHTGVTLTGGEKLWNNDAEYGSSVRWISKNTDVAEINNNTISIKDVVNGTMLPINAEVTYQSGDEAVTFTLAYTVSVVTDNTLLVPGTNIDPVLYNALKIATGVNGNLTTDALKNNKFVYLDLSPYPEIQDLSALTYCVNLRVLNISGLHVNESSLNQICTLSKLEALIANNCGIESLTVGGAPVMDKMINLKMLDLAHNRLTSLDSVLSKNNRYGQLEELYLNDNQLTDISALCEVVQNTVETKDSAGKVTATYTENIIKNRAPMLRFLILDNNHLDNDDLTAFGNFKILKYLSLGNNDITSVSSLKDVKTLLELHLQGNRIEDIRDLRFLTHLQSLYLSNNNLRNVFAGAREINISYLRYLTNLEILYLNDNNIEDISDLSALNKLAVLNVNNNRIQDLSVLADKGDTLIELYAEHNEIDSFSFVRNLTKLTRLMLSDNGGVYESALNAYLGNLTELRTLTLSGKDLRDLSFLNNMKKLVRLDAADCSLPSYYISSYTVKDSALTVNSYVDNIAALCSLRSTLRYLDVSNNGMAYGAKGIKEYLAGTGADVSFDSIAFSGSRPMTFDALYEMTNLRVFYADNLADDVDAPHLFSVMTGLNYLSMENCGITDTSWLAKFRNLIYVDLAGNNLTGFDLGNTISVRSRATLEYLYIDSKTPCTFANAAGRFDDNILREFSASGADIGMMDKLPDMDELEYLNISCTGITALTGDNPDFEGYFDLSRYKKIRTLDISGLSADIDNVQKLPALETLYAVGDAYDAIFQKHNLLKLYDLHNAGIACYLYSYDSKYVPVAKTEGDVILGTLKDYSCKVSVAMSAESTAEAPSLVISDNNPMLPASVNGFDITWSVSDSYHYTIRDNRLAVLNHYSIDDDSITLTASIDVYPDQAAVTRDFTIDVSVLRLSEDNLSEYLRISERNASPYLTIGSEFLYDISVAADKADGFEKDVMPVFNYITYDYSSALSSGDLGLAANIADNGKGMRSSAIQMSETAGWDKYALCCLDYREPEADHTYTILNTAPLSSVLNIKVEIGHYVNGTTKIKDHSILKPITISARTFTLTYSANGGTVTSVNDGHVIEQEQRAEQSKLFTDISCERAGYLLNGWYEDEGLTKLFWNEEMDYPQMPDHDITLYAGWTPYQFTVTFNANGGSVSPTSMPVLVSAAYGTLPVPVWTGHTFNGWYTEAAGGEMISETSIVNLSEDQTLYAHWTVKAYTVTFDANGGSCSTKNKTVTFGLEYGALPVPTRTGFSFNGWYTASSGGSKISAASVVMVEQNQTLYAQWTPNSFTVSWADGTGYKISVSRTASPYGKAASGALSNGATIYYGDTLSVRYTASSGYSIGSSGQSTVTVTGNVSSGIIYAAAVPNNYSYNIVYVSSNGTSLGNTAVTYAYGTTNTISAPSFNGYITPVSQSVKWDSTAAKTITFVYKPSAVSGTTVNGYYSSDHIGSYTVSFTCTGRTASAATIKVDWFMDNFSGCYDQYSYLGKVTVNGVSTGEYRIVEALGFDTWSYASRSCSFTITVPVSTTNKTDLPVAYTWIQRNFYDYYMWEAGATCTVTIPAY